MKRFALLIWPLLVLQLVLAPVLPAAVPVATPEVVYTASGGATSYAYLFRIYAATDLKVSVAGVLKTYGADYSVTGVNNPAGGTVVFGVAPADGAQVKITRAVPLDRATDYTPGGPLTAATLNKDFDRIVSQVQDTDFRQEQKGARITTLETEMDQAQADLLEHRADIDQAQAEVDAAEVSISTNAGILSRALKFPEGDSTSATLPDVYSRGGKLLGFNAAGAPITISNQIGTFAADITVENIAALRTLPAPAASNTIALVLGYYTPGDGGGGPARVWKSGAAPGTYVDNGGSIIVPNGGNGSAAWVWEYSGPVSVKWFGAKGDGVRDDTTEIRAAFNDILASNGELDLVDGDYAVTSPLVVKKTNPGAVTNVVISGPGRILKGGGFTGGRLFLFEDNFFDEDVIVFRDITVDGVDKTVNGFDWYKTTIAYNADISSSNDSDYSKAIKFQSVNVIRCYYGARQSGNYNNWTNCTFRDNICGALLNVGSNAHTFVGCTFRRGVVGVHIKTFSASLGTINNTFVGCTFESNSATGVILENLPTNTSFYSCYFENNGTGTLNPTGYSLATVIPEKTHVYFVGGSAYGSNSTLFDTCFFEPAGGVVVAYGYLDKVTFRKTSGSLTPTVLTNCHFVETVPTFTAFPPGSYGNPYYINGERYVRYASGEYRLDSDALSDLSAYGGARNVKASNTAFYGSIAKAYTEAVYATGSKSNLAAFALDSKILSARVEISVTIWGNNSGGNYSHGAAIRRSGWIWRNFNDGLLVFTPDSTSKANTAATAGGTTLGAMLDGTSEITVDTATVGQIKVGVSNMINTSVSGLGTCAAANYSVRMEFDAVSIATAEQIRPVN